MAKKIFLTGATGYVGGAVGVRLVREGARVTGLVRSPEKAAGLKSFGIEPLVGSLDDAELLRRAARDADVVIDAADMYHAASAHALVEGLAGSGGALIHASGTSVVADYGTGDAGTAIYDEDVPIVPVEEKRGMHEVDRFILASAGHGVRGVVLCLSAIYGPGDGLKTHSKKVPFLVAKARTANAGVHVGHGENIWSFVHMDDVVDLFLRAIDRAPAGGFYYGEYGESSYLELARSISRGLGFGGRTVSWPLDDAIAEVGRMHAVFALASNVRVRGKRSRAELGWNPRHPSINDYVEAELTAERGQGRPPSETSAT